MNDLISRADAIEAVCDGCVWYKTASCEEGKEEWECSEVNKIRHLPSADAEKPCKTCGYYNLECPKDCEYSRQSADAEPKWNCTANFVAEQLDRLRNMTDEEKWEFFRKFFGMGDAVQGEWVEVEDYNGDVHYKCDQCGEEWTFPFGTPKENNANFCPNCGSRMENKE